MSRLATVWLSPLFFLSVLSAVLLASAPTRGAGDLLPAIAARLDSSERIDGRFEQSREVSFLSRPLIATGSFTIDSAGGLTWLVEQPVRSLMEVRGNVVALDGKVVDDPGTGHFMAMILAAFMQRDLAPVAEQFEVDGENNAEDWQLNLTPRNVLWRRAIAGVTLHGDAYLRTVTISETDGSATRIVFSDVFGDAAGEP